DEYLEQELQLRRAQIRTAYDANRDGIASNLVYLKEAYYFVPIQLAVSLQAAGQYLEALDWYRTVYDYGANPALDPQVSKTEVRKIYAGLVEEGNEPTTYARVPDWLRDPLNPHSIAETRRWTYTRYTVESIIRCVLDYADADFTRDTAESVARARELYERAVDLLDVSELQQSLGTCADIIGLFVPTIEG